MTVKEYLNKLTVLKQKTNQKKEELKCMKQEIGISKKADCSAGKIQTSFRRTGSRTEQQAIRMATLENAVNESILTYLEERNSMIDRIHELDNGSYIEILHKRYVEDNRNFENIAIDMGYSYQYTINKHSEALKAFENKFPELF